MTPVKNRPPCVTKGGSALLRVRALGLVVVVAAGCGEGGLISPPVPVVVSLRDSLVGEGKVAIFSNQSANRLTIEVLMENKRKNERLQRNLDLGPNGTAEIGWMEGWTFESGETITISHPNYRSKTERIP